MSRITLVVAVLLLLCVPALSDTVTVYQTVTYEDNQFGPNGPCFIPRDWTLDHDYRKGSWQDWGWTHNMIGVEPAGAIGVVSATLKVRNWDVADEWGWDGSQYVWCPEDDRIYAIRTSGGTLVSFIRDGDTPQNPYKLPATLIGSLAQCGMYQFGSTYLTISDAGVLADLWSNGALGFFMNIDALASPYCGHQVTLIYAMLTVDYIVPHDPQNPWEPTLPVYRFWSPKAGQHFYTTSESEKNKLITQYPPSVWTYEDVAFHTYPDNRQNDAHTYPAVSPVYRFWCSRTGEHFFTISETEKDKLMGWCTDDQAKSTGIPSTWTYEGIAFYAHAEGQQPTGADPVYRFWSPKTGEHFYTINEAEKDKILAKYPASVWTYEGIGWYTYP